MTKFNPEQIFKIVEKPFLKKNIPKICVGDTVKISIKSVEGNKERIQYYEGIILSKKNSFINTTITVKKIVQGINVEKIFLLNSPKIKSIIILKSAKIRRSKLYYLRNLKGKASRLKQKFKV